jgi:hypothetical protein
MEALKVFFIFLIFLLAACVSQPGTWVKDSSSSLQVDQDKYTCLREAQQPYGYSDGSLGWGLGGGYSGYLGVRTNQELLSACMKAKGYQWYLEKNPA